MNGHVAVLGTRGYPSFYGGFETLLRHLVPYLADNGWTVDVYNRRGATSADHTLSDAERARVHRFTTPCIERQSLSTLTHGASSALHAGFKRNPDVALVMNVANGYWLPYLRTMGIPTVVNVDGIEWERDKWGSMARRVFRHGAGLTARHADEIVVDSKEIARRWQRTFGRTGTFIPYGGSNPGRVPPHKDFPAGSYVLMVARLVPENTVREFLDSAAVIARTCPVVIVGSSGYGGEIEAEVKLLAENTRDIHWFGHIRDDDALFALWANAGVYFHGHSVGGTNPALVQAMACGTPTVARDTLFNREVLGDAGSFVQPDPHEIAQAVLRLMQDPAKRADLAERARTRQTKEYDWSAVCTAYDQLLTTTAETRQRHPSRSRHG